MQQSNDELQRKKILFISYDGMCDPLGQSQVIPYLEQLAQLGHRIHLLSAEKKKNFGQQKEKIQEQLRAANIPWMPVKYSNLLPGISAWMTFRRLNRAAKTLQRIYSFNIIHCRSYIPALIGQHLKKVATVKFIFDMRGFWADERVEGGIWNLKNPLYKKAFRFFKKKEKEFLLESDAIISLTENAKQELISRNEVGIAPGKISVIPCCADLDFFSDANVTAEKKSALRKQLGIDEVDLVLSYSGSWGTWYLTKEMMLFFKLLSEKKLNSKFLIISPDPSSAIHHSARQVNVDKSKLIIRSANRNEMPGLLSISHASIFFIKNSFSKRASSPTKMGEVMGMGIPIICNEGVGDVGKIMNETGAGICLALSDENKFSAAIEQFDELLKIEKTKIRNGAIKFFSLHRGVECYHQIYSSF